MTCSAKTMSWWMLPAVLAFFVGSILVQTQLDVRTGIRTVNPDGPTGRALVVYHAGLSDFQQDVTEAYVEGLTSAGWRSDLTTASCEAPTDLGGYDLLVVGAPIYAWHPAPPLTRHLDRIEDLGGLPVADLLTAAGITGEAPARLHEQIERLGGVVVQSTAIFQAAPNEDIHGISDPLEIARRAGASLALP